MAAVSQHLGMGVYDFAHKICSRYLVKSQNIQGTIRASSLSVAFLLGDNQHGELHGAEIAADRVTVGVSRDSYTRLTPVCGSVDVWGNRIDAGHCCYLGRNKEYLLLNKTRDGSTKQSFVKFWRTYNSRFTRRLQSLGSRRLCWGHGQSVFVRSYSGNGTQSVPLYETKAGYYEILEVTPTATQAQIKTAYYKQSFIYHPDRNAGSDAATVRFSEINEAYTVLGNKALRKKYDRGLLSRLDLVATARPSGKDTAGSSAKHQADRRRSVMGADRQGTVFDFDKFFKAHYSEQLQREKDIRTRKEELLKKKQETIEERKLGSMLEVGVGLMLAMILVILMSVKR